MDYTCEKKMRLRRILYKKENLDSDLKKNLIRGHAYINLIINFAVINIPFVARIAFCVLCILPRP